MILSRKHSLLWFSLASLLIAPATAAPVALPDKAPVPPVGERSTPLPPVLPVPEERPTQAPPLPKPGDVAKEPGPKAPQEDERSDFRPIDPMPKQELACRERLKQLDVAFEERKPARDDTIGCALPYPLLVSTLGSGLTLVPPAEMNCQMAEATARFMARTVSPAAKANFGAGLKSVNQASAYVCRPRHNGAKMSEHAFGNALDIAAFTLSDDTRVDIEPAPSAKNGKFLADIREAACGPFKTVLGPGSDPDHELHFHLDLEPRRNGGTFCQ